MSGKRISIDAITKIEGGAGLEVVVENGAVRDLRFIIADYRRFFTTAVRGKRMVAVPSFLSRICGTCSVAHLFASLMAIEDSQGIEVSEQTKTLRRPVRAHHHTYPIRRKEMLGYPFQATRLRNGGCRVRCQPLVMARAPTTAHIAAAGTKLRITEATPGTGGTRITVLAARLTCISIARSRLPPVRS